MKRILFCLLLLSLHVANAQYLPFNGSFGGNVNSSDLNVAGKLFNAQNAIDNYGPFLSFGTADWTLQFNATTQANSDVYTRVNGYGGLGTWYKLWHSGNLQLPFHQWQNYIGNNIPGSLDNMPANSSVFAYPSGQGGINTNAPTVGAVVHFSGLGDGRYGMQLQSYYGTGELYTRSKNDDAGGTWSTWRKILSENAAGNVGIGTTTPSWYYHGGNNRVLEILNPNSETNSQSHIILSTGATANFGSVGSVSFMAANAVNNKGVAYIGATLTSDASINASGDLVFATANANVPLEKMRIDHNGNVGIGTAVPTRKLEVISGAGVGPLRVAGANGSLLIDNVGSGENYYAASVAHYFQDNSNNIRMAVFANGNVGINTASPTEKLSVNGNIRSRKVIVTQTGWPDYVFDSSYQLPSLDSVSTFIQANKHLPDMPSAATVEKDGHDLGEVQKLLLKKMEEMTLYMIEMKKENELMKKEIEQLKGKK